MSNFIFIFYNSISIYNYTQYSQLQKTKNKSYVVKTTYGSIANIYNYKKYKK